jgi:hypothetical protein
MTMPAFVLLSMLTQDPAAAPPPPQDVQVAAAVLAAPEDRRAGATVLGYDAKGTLVTLRKGTNDMVCLADDPRNAAFSVACYHKDLEPFMARGRELLAQGVTDEKARSNTRWEEIKAGKLPMSREPRTLYVLTGASYDAATGKVADQYLRFVIYMPFATAETTGLSTKPVAAGGPWLMNAGTAGAHVMINPPRK